MNDALDSLDASAAAPRREKAIRAAANLPTHPPGTGCLSRQLGRSGSGGQPAGNLHCLTGRPHVPIHMYQSTKCSRDCLEGEGRRCLCSHAATRAVYRRFGLPLAAFALLCAWAVLVQQT